MSRRGVLVGATALGLGACVRTQPLDAHVIVIGAGLSGLYAARLLVAEGKDVLVLEASDRVGGRTHSIEVDGHVMEAGGEQIGASYARIRDVAREEGLDIAPDGRPLPMRLHMGGEWIEAQDWADHALNPMPEAYKSATPGSALVRAALKVNPLEDPTAWTELEDVSADSFLAEAGFSHEARRLIDHTLNGEQLESYGMANLYRSLALYALDRAGGPSGHLTGGMQSLCTAMAAKLDVQRGEVVRAIRESADGVEVETEGRVWRAEQVISTLPLPVYKKMEMRTTFDVIALAEELPYTPIHQVHFRSDPIDYHIWSDGPMERIFAHHDAEGQPTGLFRAWINGRGANHQTITANARDTSRLALPELLGQEVEILREVSWTALNPLAGGAYRHFKPGQSKQYGRAFGDQTGRVRFAGEHTSLIYTGMEGAMESGEREAYGLLGY